MYIQNCNYWEPKNRSGIKIFMILNLKLCVNTFVNQLICKKLGVSRGIGQVFKIVLTDIILKTFL